MLRPGILLFEGCDFETFPVGGQLSMARSLLKMFGNSFALVGIATGDETVGVWREKKIDGTPYWFFPVCRRDVSAQRPLVPARLTYYLALKRYRRRIEMLHCRYAFTQAPEALLGVARWGFESVCYMFPGVENPLRISRYALARRLCRVYEIALFSALRNASVVLACADEDAIARFVSSSRGRVSRQQIVQIPTCVDLEQFRPAPIAEARKALGIPADSTVFVTSGRIGKFKGWPLLLDAFAEFRRRIPESLLIFIGDGEERPLLEGAIAARDLQSSVRITGFQPAAEVARYLNAANAVALGSYAEGWSVAMVEALACGKAIVTTPVSGTREMIIEGRNGLIVQSRDPVEYAAAMEQALGLTDAPRWSTPIADQYSLHRIRERLRELWTPLKAVREWDGGAARGAKG
ncbi:MAG TPA: glycosyltransferase [Terriglobia bacterium]|nr:glycosyltransferase [Terriglobia bacterium]